MNNELIITDGKTWVTINEYSDGGYYYDIYSFNPELDETRESDDGGLCTGNLEDAIIMATSQAGLVDPNEPRQPQDDEESKGGTFLVAFAGQYTRIKANDKVSALYQAQCDYNRPPTKRLLDWKDSEQEEETWSVEKLID